MVLSGPPCCHGYLISPPPGDEEHSVSSNGPLNF